MENANRVQPYLSWLALAAGGYAVALALWPFWITTGNLTRVFLGAACVAGGVLGTLSGRRVFYWQYEHRILRKLNPGDDGLIAPGLMLGICLPAALALAVFWFGTMPKRGGNFELFGSGPSVVPSQFMPHRTGVIPKPSPQPRLTSASTNARPASSSPQPQSLVHTAADPSQTDPALSRESWPGIRRNEQSISSQQVRSFVQERVSMESTRDIGRILPNYAERVVYWNHGMVDHDFILKDKTEYFGRWPVSQEDILGDVAIERLPTGWRATFQTRFRVENPASGVSIHGRQQAELMLALQNGKLKITAEKGEVQENQRLEKPVPATISPMPGGGFPGERFPETRTTSLDSQALSKTPADDLRYAINEMFARHGADFPSAEIKQQFNRFPWYQPRPGMDFDAVEERFFSPLEKANLKLLGEARKTVLASKPDSAAPVMPATPSTPRKTPLRPGAKARVVTAQELKTLVGQRLNDTWCYGSFIASRTSGDTVVMYPIRAGGLLRDYATEVHATFRTGVFPFPGRERLPMDPIDSTVGVRIDHTRPLRITSISRATKPGTSKVIVVVRAEQ